MKKKYLISLLLVVLALAGGIYQYYQTFKSEIAEAYQMTKPANGHSWTEMQCTSDVCVNTIDHRVGIGTDNPNKALDVVGDIVASGDICNGSSKCLSTVSQTNVIAGANPTCATGETIIMKAYNGTWYAGDNASITTWSKVICGTQVTNDGTPLLVNNKHTEKNCTDTVINSVAGVVATDASGNKMCKFNSATCPTATVNWVQHLNWSTTTAGGAAPASPVTSCNSCSFSALSGATATGHAWANLAVESVRNCTSCIYDNGFPSPEYWNNYNSNAGQVNVCTTWNCMTGINACGGMNACGAYATSTRTQIGCY
jgi:hypothetical protein